MNTAHPPMSKRVTQKRQVITISPLLELLLTVRIFAEVSTKAGDPSFIYSSELCRGGKLGHFYRGKGGMEVSM